MQEINNLVDSLEWGNCLALILVKGIRLHSTVCEIDLAMRFFLVSESVLHPVDVITVGVVFTSVCTTGLSAVGGSYGSLGTMELSVKASRL